MLEKFTELTSIYKRQPDNKIKKNWRLCYHINVYITILIFQQGQHGYSQK